MAKKQKIIRPKARLPKGMRDVGAQEMRAMEVMFAKVRAVYESYGFEPLDTPAFEYSDALGKFLPDQDRPNEGVFSFEYEDGDWVSLRYDLTAPLARYVAQNYDGLAKPFRRYQVGPVWRNEKPGPGRFRQFFQFDADTVGTAHVAADAELCMLAADCYEAIGLSRGAYSVRINSRKILDGVLETIGIDPQDPGNATQRMTVLRAIDKLDRLGLAGVEALLGEGRKDESGDFTKGAGLSANQIASVLDYLSAQGSNRAQTLKSIEKTVAKSEVGEKGLIELKMIDQLLTAAGFADDRVTIDPCIVRGLEYYTGCVFEAELIGAQTEDGEPVNVGSVGSGGRYDGLVQRFKGVEIPATGFSVGVSRLYAAFLAMGKFDRQAQMGPVVVLVMDQDEIEVYQAMTRQLREEGIRAEMYLGTSGMKAQMKYADKRGAPCVVIQGEDERSKGEIVVKDLIEGAKMSEEIADNVEWREGRPAQFSVKTDELIEGVRSVLDRYL